MQPIYALLVLIAIDVAIVGVVLLARWIANQRAFPRMTNTELDVLGCLWQMPRNLGETHRRYRRRLAHAVRRYPRD